MLNPQSLQNNTTNVIIQQNSHKLLMMDILMSETCWAHKKWNKIASDIKLVFFPSNIYVKLSLPLSVSCTGAGRKVLPPLKLKMKGKRYFNEITKEICLHQLFSKLHMSCILCSITLRTASLFRSKLIMCCHLHSLDPYALWPVNWDVCYGLQSICEARQMKCNLTKFYHVK